MTVIHIGEWRPGEATHAANARRVRPEHHVSADQQWLILRDPDITGSAWWVEHRPTRLVVAGDVFSSHPFPTLDVAQAWTSQPDAVDLLKAQAVRMLAGDRISEAAEARHAFMVWGIVLLPAGTDVEHHCVCGGFLGYTPGRVLAHVDVCADELRPTAGDGRCPDLGAHHVVCLQPEPIQCEHAHCRTGNRYDVSPCPDDKMSCGCCLARG